MMGIKQRVPSSVDEYIAAQPEALRPKLEQVRFSMAPAKAQLLSRLAPARLIQILATAGV